MARARRYWLFKTEPGVYSMADLVRDRRTTWEGIRNYQARNLLRDEVAAGDGVLVYHSSAEPLAVAGIARVARAGYPDHFAWQAGHRYFDARSDPQDPTWYMVDVEAVLAFDEPVTREAMKARKGLAGMMVLQRGSRLSIQPVRAAEWRAVLKMAGIDGDPS